MRGRIVPFLLVLFLWSPVEADDRWPVPDKSAQNKADALVQELFGDEIKKATSTQKKSALVKKLLEQAGEATEPENRFAVYKAALGVAPDALVAMSIIDGIARHFVIDDLKAKSSTVWNLSKTARTPEEHQAVAEAALQLIDAHVGGDDVDAAEKLVEVANAAARKSRDTALIRTVRARADEISQLRAKFRAVQAAIAELETNPTDPQANAEVGKYRCFVQGDWDGGLPLLALGDDENLKSLAIRELKSPTDKNDQVSLADAWFEFGESSSDQIKRRSFQRSAVWYRTALRAQPPLSGLVKAKVEKRLDELSAVETSDDPPEQPTGPFKDFAGTWTIKYGTGVGRQYVIDGLGNVSNGPAQGRLENKDGHVLLDFGDGRLERMRIDGALLRVEFFNPATKFPNNPLLAVGTKIQKIDKSKFKGFAALRGNWTLKYTRGHLREYSIDASGNVTLTNAAGTPRGKLYIENGDILLDFNDGKIERWHLGGTSLMVEHFNPKSQYPHHINCYASGVRKN